MGAAGVADPSKPRASRIQGPTRFIDFSDQRDGADDIHALYRSCLGDLGLPAAR
jgi:hypothetical protein